MLNERDVQSTEKDSLRGSRWVNRATKPKQRFFRRGRPDNSQRNDHDSDDDNTEMSFGGLAMAPNKVEDSTKMSPGQKRYSRLPFYKD